MAEMLTVQDVAEELRCSTKLVRALCARQQLPYHRVGDLIRIERRDLERFLKEHRVEYRPSTSSRSRR